MLTTIAGAILEALSGMNLFRKTDIWKGELPELMNLPKALPAAFVVLTASSFLPIKTLPPTTARLRMQWDVLLIYTALSASRISAPAGYELIETVIAPASAGGITGLKVDDFGILWPEDLELISAQNGVCVYRIGFYMDAECTGI